MKKIGIIGGAGFIGSHITRLFLEKGLSVKVSATDPSQKEKYQHLLQLVNADNVELVSLNVENKDALRGFVNGCDVVIHCGTPFKLAIQDPQTELFDPTVKGTK